MSLPDSLCPPGSAWTSDIQTGLQSGPDKNKYRCTFLLFTATWGSVCVCVCVCVSRQRKLPQIPTKLRVIRGARCWAGRIYEPLQTWSASYRGVNVVFNEPTVNIIHHQIVGQVWNSLASEKSPGRGNTAEVCYLSEQLGQQVGRWWDVLLPSLCKVFFFSRSAAEVWRKASGAAVSFSATTWCSYFY